jgi:hypothetical protein
MHRKLWQKREPTRKLRAIRERKAFDIAEKIADHVSPAVAGGTPEDEQVV